MSVVAKYGYVHGSISVGTSAVQVKVGGSNLSNRQCLVIFNKSTSTIYRGGSDVTTSNGVPIEPSQETVLYVSDSIDVFLIAGSASNNVIVEEWA